MNQRVRKSERAAARTLRLAITLIAACALANPAGAQGDAPGVTDLSGADASAIQMADIIQALAVPRGTTIEPSSPPTVRLPVFFEFNSATLQPDAVVLLEKVGAALSAEELDSFRFSVEGHTDSVGSDVYNKSLSQRRAGAVREFLMAEGVPQDRLGTLGHGEAIPVASNGSDDGRQRNRRVEVINLGAQR